MFKTVNGIIVYIHWYTSLLTKDEFGHPVLLQESQCKYPSVVRKGQFPEIFIFYHVSFVYEKYKFLINVLCNIFFSTRLNE